MSHRCILLRLIALILCLLMSLTSVSAEGFGFTLHASLDPAHYPADLQPLMNGLASLLDASAMEGTLVTQGTSFALDGIFMLDDGSRQSQTAIRVYGLDSHWGVRSSLLGEEELMVNNSSLLAFGQKTNDWLGIPLDKAALLVPYTHAYALQSVWEVVMPLFPAEPGKRTFTRAELDDMARTLLTLCDEDAALNRWLDVTGLNATVTRYIKRFLELPALVVPGMTVSRTERSLTWDVYFVNILTIQHSDAAFEMNASIPTFLSVNASVTQALGQITGDFHAQLGESIQAEAAFVLPAALPSEQTGLYLTVNASAPKLPEDGFHLSLQGEASGGTLVIRQLDPDSGAVMLTLSAELSAFTPEELPSYTPADLTGMNVLSVNGDSLRELMHAVRRPLLSGAIDLITAAPPEAVQALMDYAEDSGLLDLLTDALSGGSGY